MTDKPTPMGPAEIVGSTTICSLDEVCEACHVEAAWITELVEHGVIEPVERGGASWRFSSLAIVRVAKAKRLERDLSLNTPGVALALELLDEIEDLRTRLKALEARS
jgi:chaperone modulatory protein CbpM